MKLQTRIIFIAICGWICFCTVEYYFTKQMVTNEMVQQSLYSERQAAENTPIWVKGLRQWMWVTSLNNSLGISAKEFLKQNLVNDNEEDNLDLSKLGKLWDTFCEKRPDIMEHTLKMFSDTLKPDDEITIVEINKWAEFIGNILRKNNPNSENNGDSDNVFQYGIPNESDHQLSEEVILTLNDVVAIMNKFRRRKKPLGESLDIFDIPENGTEKDLAAWQRFQNHIRRHRLYSTTDPTLDDVLYDMKTLAIEELETLEDRGTQVKFIFWLEDGSRVLAKPQRWSIDRETPEDTYTFDDMERFQAEVGAFHLDRLLGFNRVPPVVTRYVNATGVIKRLAPKDLRRTFYSSAVGNVCFYGKCDQFCDTAFAICGKPDLVAMSLAFYLPSRNEADRSGWDNPWAGSYSRSRKPPWQDNDNYCNEIKEQDPELLEKTRRLLDLMDVAVFDFFQANLDRHSYHTFERFDNNTNIILYDNGRGFPRSYRDEMLLLAPIYQCCLIRRSTLDMLWKLYTDDVKLSTKMNNSLAVEDVQPLLNDKHLHALDRRLSIILKTVYDCISKADMDYKTVIKDDGY